MEPDGGGIKLDSNENPVGPGRVAMEALLRAFEDAGRYPTNSRTAIPELREGLARKFGVKVENIVLGAGSGELLRNFVRLFTSPTRPLVAASPTFELPEWTAALSSVPVRRVPVDAAGRLSLERMIEAARWAGAIYFCNPNNPTGTVHSAKAVSDFISQVRKESPDTAVLIDEAYHDYVADPSYATALSLALDNPNVFITRTFSKAYGMAGLRIGYALAQRRSIEAMTRWAMPYNQNALGLAAAVASLGDPVHIEEEQRRNAEVRAFTSRFFTDAGFKVMDSQANFVFVDLGKPAKEFRDACGRRKVFVGRGFPPLEKTHARISLGTMDEMRAAVAAFGEILGIKGVSNPGAD